MFGRTRSGEVTTSTPKTLSCPEVGTSRVEAILRNVVFPAPLRPSRQIRSPAPTRSETPERAFTAGAPRLR
jgi:hypothetical protein